MINLHEILPAMQLLICNNAIKIHKIINNLLLWQFTLVAVYSCGGLLLWQFYSCGSLLLWQFTLVAVGGSVDYLAVSFYSRAYYERYAQRNADI